MGSAICGEYLDDYLGPPPPESPKCRFGKPGNTHRERYMEYRKGVGEHGGFRCTKCGSEVTWEDNILMPHNDWYRARVARFEKRLRERERFGGLLD